MHGTKPASGGVVKGREVTTMNPLHDIPTGELVAELKRRDGVEVKIAEPYQDITVSVNGPATVLTVVD